MKPIMYLGRILLPLQRMLALTLCAASVSLIFVQSTSASDGLPDPGDALVLPDSSEAGEELPDSGPEPEPPSDADDYVMMPMAISGSVYPGTISATYTDYFAGIIAQNLLKKYVIFRETQYVYTLFYGDISLVGSTVQGSGQYVKWNTQNTSAITRGTDTISVNISSGHVYTNLDSRYPVLVEVEQYAKIFALLAACAVFFAFSVFGLFFFRRR